MKVSKESIDYVIEKTIPFLRDNDVKMFKVGENNRINLNFFVLQLYCTINVLYLCIQKQQRI